MSALSVADLRPLPPVFSYAQARARGLTDRALRNLVAQGAIELLSRGVYKRTDVETAELELDEIAVRAPRATLCLTTALSRHELTDTIPATIDVALPQGTWPPKISAPVTWHSFARGTFDIGRETLALDGHRIGIYSAPRTIVDTFRLRHREGYELPVEALKNWLRRRGSKPATLLEIARQIDRRSEASIRTVLEILL